MIVTKITQFLLTVVTVLITPLKWVMTVPTYILINAPLIKVVYQLLVAAIWFPFGVFITAMSSVYRVPVIGFILALAGIPVVLIGYAIGYLLSPRIKEERAFIEASQSYPSVGKVI